MELLGKLARNDTPNIGMRPSASKDVSIRFAKQCLHILVNNDRVKKLKGSTKIQEIGSLFKYQSHFYNV